MRLGRRLSAGIAHDPPAPAAVTETTEPTVLAASTVTSPDQRAAEIGAAAARREFGELTHEH